VNSSIAYDKAVFRNEKELTLSGEAFFDVRKDQSKKLTIRCGDILIKDIGTKFNVKAYADSLLLIVSVKEGSVKLYSLNQEGVIINAGFEGVYDKRSGAFYVQPLRNKNIAAYHDRILIFENTSVAEAIGLLEKLYGISVRIDNEAIKKCRFSATFNNESIDTILDILSETLNLRLSKSNKKYEISGEGCYNEI
jgi:ferric-dicitrate binding protein FerR (iron transport regulator)